MMEQWEIQRTQGRCAGTDRVLEPGEEYYAALIDTQETFERRDYCAEYWEAHHPEVFSFWKTQIPLPSEKKKLFVDDSVLINFFERLGQETEPLKIQFRFVLTLILMRKRLLKYEDSSPRDGQEIWNVRLMRDKEFHEVINPNLTDEQIEQVSGELGVILQGDF